MHLYSCTLDDNVRHWEHPVKRFCLHNKATIVHLLNLSAFISRLSFAARILCAKSSAQQRCKAGHVDGHLKGYHWKGVVISKLDGDIFKCLRASFHYGNIVYSEGIFQTGTSFIMQALKQEIGSVVPVNYPFGVPEEPPLLCIYAKNARLVVTQLEVYTPACCNVMDFDRI